MQCKGVKIFSYSINSSVYYGFHSFWIYGLQPAVRNSCSLLLLIIKIVADKLLKFYFISISAGQL